MKYFFRGYIPKLHKVVLVESGERELYETFLPGLYQHCSEIDVVTCFAGAPTAFRPEQGRLFQIADYATAEARGRLVTELQAGNYSAIGIICSEQPIMTKWKWLLAAKVPAKLFILNENGDYFWCDITNWRTIREFIVYRAGLSGAGAVRNLGRLLIFPFTVLFLLLYAAYMHTRRIWNIRMLRQTER